MQRVLVLGAGKIGALISGLLAESGDYTVALADVRGDAARSVVRAHGLKGLTAHEFDAADGARLAAQLREHPVEAVVSSLPYYCNPAVAQAARDAGLHYFDLTEDVEVTRAVRAEAEGAATAFVPQCGLACTRWTSRSRRRRAPPSCSSSLSRPGRCRTNPHPFASTGPPCASTDPTSEGRAPVLTSSPAR